VVTQPKEATRALKWAVEEMEKRYMLLSDRGVRNIEAYNRRMVREKKLLQKTLLGAWTRTCHTLWW
jgi:DNA segregation ATPase FtsK/SpoIIIE, S-DNA-T family